MLYMWGGVGLGRRGWGKGSKGPITHNVGLQIMGEGRGHGVPQGGRNGQAEEVRG